MTCRTSILISILIDQRRELKCRAEEMLGKMICSVHTCTQEPRHTGSHGNTQAGQEAEDMRKGKVSTTAFAGFLWERQDRAG